MVKEKDERNLKMGRCKTHAAKPFFGDKIGGEAYHYCC